MATKASFWDHPIAKIEEVLSIKRQITELQSRLSSMFDGGGKPAGKGKRTRSPEVRARMAAAQKARWANRGSASGKASASIAPKGKRRGGKRTMSPEGRARISAAAKARWAARRKAE